MEANGSAGGDRRIGTRCGQRRLGRHPIGVFGNARGHGVNLDVRAVLLPNRRGHHLGRAVHVCSVAQDRGHQPSGQRPGSLTYTMAAGTPIKVVASNPCWVEVRAAASGPITHVATLQAGHGLSLPSPLWMRLGNPANVQVTAGTTALQLPVGPGDLVIQSVTPGG